MAKRTTHRSSSGKKLHAVRDAKGRFKDIQTYERAHRQDIKRKGKKNSKKHPHMPVSIALVGDYEPAVTAHRAIPHALALAGVALGLAVAPRWISTTQLARAAAATLAECDGVWCVPASPYHRMDGALGAIRFAREQRRPFLGTCGGCQHALLEYFRHVLGLAQAEHLESSPGASIPLIAPLECALIECAETVELAPGSRLRALYGHARVEEQYHCRYGLNPEFEHLLHGGTLRIVGRGAGGAVRAVELEGHPFYVATLFQPERSALRGEVHPLIRGFVQAAARR